MISDSIPWKDELLKIADRLEGRTTQRRWTERTFFLVERDVMNGAYAIRRLHESHKISDELTSETVSARRHRLTGKPVDLWSRYEFFEHYDMAHPAKVGLTLTDFCNQVIHSWVWMLSFEEHHPHLWDGIFVSSEWARRKHVHFLGAETLIRLFRDVGDDAVNYARMRRDEDGNIQYERLSRYPD